MSQQASMTVDDSMLDSSLNTTLGMTSSQPAAATTTRSSEQLLILRRDGQPNQSIQALISNRMHNRKKIIVDYLNKHKICTKYDITREIRAQESALKLTGSIDAKTTKRMLMTLVSEQKLRVFEVPLKSVSYMCVCAADIDESHEVYRNYCSTFRRTFDSVDLKMRGESGDEASDDEDEIGGSGGGAVGANVTFKLTNSYIESVVSKLKFLNVRKRLFSIVPKFQKAIILHRFLHYLLFFYNGHQQSVSFI